MKKLILASLVALATSILPSWGQLAVYGFDITSTAGNGLGGNNATGVGLKGTVKVFAASLEFNLTNTGGSNGVTSSELTGFGFWNNPDASSDWSLVSTTGWQYTANINDLWHDATYNGAESTTNTERLSDGEMRTFTFAFNGSSGATMNDLMDSWNTNGDFDMVARFQSVDGGGLNNTSRETSDKVGINFAVVPEPSTYGLIGAGALVLLVAMRRFKKN